MDVPPFSLWRFLNMDLHKMMTTGEGIEQLKDNLLDLDSEFRFKCRRCGKCCVHQDTILLNTRDIYNIARKQGRTMRDVVESYTEVYIGKNSRIPVIHLLSNGPKGACPLLVDGRCSVHDCKPTVCALFPLGRVIAGKKPGEPITAIEDMQVRYILNDISCGSAKRVNTVRSWLAKFGIPERDEYHLLWTKTTMHLTEAIWRMEKLHCPEKALSPVWDIIFNLLYLDYDTSTELMPQFQAAANKLMELSSGLEKMCDDAERAAKDALSRLAVMEES